MVWFSLLQLTNAPLLGLIATSMDRIAVWGVLALVITLIAWREYNLPEIASMHPATQPATEK